MMALQVCNRCRKRRIRCDLQLPACKNCQVADVECLFWDDCLGRDISCSYLHSLRQKVSGLEREIQFAKDRDLPTREDAQTTNLVEQDYHLSVFDIDNQVSPSRTAYLGPGNSARLLENLLKSSVHWHLVNNLQIPNRLLSDERPQPVGHHDFKTLHSFPMSTDQRKLELHSLVPPSTQRAIIEHYISIVSPEFSLISAERESSLLGHENPLKWRNSNKDDPGAFELSLVFAISTTLVTRDLDPNMSSISTRCRENIHKISQKAVSPEDPIESTRMTCKALCALALCELIIPISGQLWDLLGRAMSTMEHLSESYQLRYQDLDEDSHQLEQSLLKLESSASLHFCRPSPLNEVRLRTVLNDSSNPSTLSSELIILSGLHNIVHMFRVFPRPSEQSFENLIPLPMQVLSITSDISIFSATVYTALHPLFTSSDTRYSGMINGTPSRLFHVIARSASIIIDHFTHLNESNKIISVWLASERVLEAGVVWATYLISQPRILATGEHRFPTMETRIVMSPILKVATLLASFAARWKGGSVYVEAWETLVELLWNMI